MGLLIFFATLIIFSRCKECYSTTVRVNEGEEALLIFHHPCNYTQVTIRHGYLSPFYDSANAESNPLPPNIHVMYENQDKTGTETCSIHLIISPVSRDDVGTYILTLYKDSQMLPEYPRILLDVSYPPGKASCTSSNDYYDGEWVSLHCTAPVGNTAGQIVCYQNDVRLPSLTKPVEDGETLSQVILVRLAEPVFCCACITSKYKESSECNDFAWDPVQNIALPIFQDTSPTFLSTQDPTTSEKLPDPTLPSNPEAVITEKPNEKEMAHNNPKQWKYMAFGLVILITILVVLYLKNKENRKFLNDMIHCNNNNSVNGYQPPYQVTHQEEKS